MESDKVKWDRVVDNIFLVAYKYKEHEIQCWAQDAKQYMQTFAFAM